MKTPRCMSVRSERSARGTMPFACSLVMGVVARRAAMRRIIGGGFIAPGAGISPEQAGDRLAVETGEDTGRAELMLRCGGEHGAKVGRDGKVAALVELAVRQSGPP